MLLWKLNQNSLFKLQYYFFRIWAPTDLWPLSKRFSVLWKTFSHSTSPITSWRTSTASSPLRSTSSGWTSPATSKTYFFALILQQSEKIKITKLCFVFLQPYPLPTQDSPNTYLDFQLQLTNDRSTKQNASCEATHWQSVHLWQRFPQFTFSLNRQI